MPQHYIMSNMKTVSELTITNNNLMKSIYDEIISREGDKIKKQMADNLKIGYTPMFFEAKEYNIYDEYMAMKNIREKRVGVTNYEEGRFRILEYMINCIIAEPIDGNYYKKEYCDSVEEAAKLLATEDALYDGLAWSFIPKRFGREIDMMFGG